MRDHGVEDKWEKQFDTEVHPGIELAAIDGVDCPYCHSKQRQPCRIVLDQRGPGSMLPEFAHISRRMALTEKMGANAALLLGAYDLRKRELDRDRAVEDMLGVQRSAWVDLCLKSRDGIQPKKSLERPDNCIHHEPDPAYTLANLIGPGTAMIDDGLDRLLGF